MAWSRCRSGERSANSGRSLEHLAAWPPQTPDRPCRRRGGGDGWIDVALPRESGARAGARLPGPAASSAGLARSRGEPVWRGRTASRVAITSLRAGGSGSNRNGEAVQDQLDPGDRLWGWNPVLPARGHLPPPWARGSVLTHSGPVCH